MKNEEEKLTYCIYKINLLNAENKLMSLEYRKILGENEEIKAQIEKEKEIRQ